VWQQVDLPIVTEAPILFDIEFDPESPKNGWIVGNRGTFLQTVDAVKTWTPKSFANLDPDEEINYRFTKVSFKNGEGWIIGKPAILLHTRDSGSSWERVPLSPKLPGDPYSIVALGPGKAEMTTSAGAIYTTENAGRNWKAEVRETIDATLNRVSSSGVQGASYFSGSINSIQRDSEGSYLAVSSRGNFYLTWKPGDEFWIPHNRETSRRITSMGFIKDRLSDGLWMTTAGGEISKSSKVDDTMQVNILSTSCKSAREDTVCLTLSFCQTARLTLLVVVAQSLNRATTARVGRRTRWLTICHPICTRLSFLVTKVTSLGPMVCCCAHVLVEHNLPAQPC